MTDDETILGMITETFENALRNTNMRYVIYRDGNTGKFYTYEDIAGGNSEPESAWNGTDEEVCEFCFQNWKPEDADENFRENLLDYLTDEQKEQLRATEEEDECELPGHEIAEMFPEQYGDYCDDIINNELENFDPEIYLNEN